MTKMDGRQTFASHAYLRISRTKRVGGRQWQFTHGRSRIEPKSLLARLYIYRLYVTNILIHTYTTDGGERGVDDNPVSAVIIYNITYIYIPAAGCVAKFPEVRDDDDSRSRVCIKVKNF